MSQVLVLRTAVIQMEARNSTGSRQTGRNARDDIKISNIDDAQEDDFDVRRLNSDPNSFFRCREESSPEPASPTCFQPLSVLVERIMMLNIAALILVFIFTLTNSMRLYFIVTGDKCNEISNKVFVYLMKIIFFLLCILYAVIIRKKLCA